MADDKLIALDIDLKGLDEALKRAPRKIAWAMRGANKEAAERVLGTQGLANYPPLTSANKPPAPYYIRGRGTQYGSGNDHSSEKYKERFYVKQHAYGVKIGNTASYAKYLGGDRVPRFHQVRGWRKLIGVARELVARGVIGGIYKRWIMRALRQIGL